MRQADPSASSISRVRVDGKFFRLGPDKFYVKGITYGPFAPHADHGPYPDPEQARRDLAQILELNANVLRFYEVPPRWFLDLMVEHGLKALIDIPWPKHLCFLDDPAATRAARAAVRQAVRQGQNHPAVFAYSVVNEIPADVARWSGVRQVERFVESLVDEAKGIDADCLCTFSSFPPTEYLQARNIDFLTFNVYLHHAPTLEAYLARLQSIAQTRPLILGEFGMDSYREGEAAQADFLGNQIQTAFRAGLAGTVVFSFTDDWFRGGHQIEDWAFGLTTRDRKPKAGWRRVQAQYQVAPHYPLPATPKVSVVVASYNGSRTLSACLDSLRRLRYPDYELILVDDGSTDDTPAIASRYPEVKVHRQPNLGLSAARNAGIQAATGTIVAFTDSDCRVDEDWLHYLVSDLVRGPFAAIGGHNLLPPEDSTVAAAVMAAPGGPAHVMLTDVEAEHIPGCNMAFYRWALDEVNGFDPIFRKAGDDVDICWRLMECGHKIGFSHSGFVWHYRRATVRAYLRQQQGYGEAEALLAQKHPEYFNPLGGSIWRGRIYSITATGLNLRRPVIYHGTFASGFFQKIYQPGPATLAPLATSLEYYACVVLPLLLMSAAWPSFTPLLLAALAFPLGLCTLAACKAPLPRAQTRPWSRPLVACMFLLQPVSRGLARYRSRWNARSRPRQDPGTRPLDAASGFQSPPWQLCYWSDGRVDRLAWLHRILHQLESHGWQTRTDTGWATFDLEIAGTQWNRHRLTTVAEELAEGRLNLRSRIESFWSLRARILFVACLAAAFPAAAYLAEYSPWAWMVLVLVGVLAWLLDLHKQTIQHLLTGLVEEAARQSTLVRVPDRPSNAEPA